MGAAIRLREDFDAVMLRGLAKCSRDGAQSRRVNGGAKMYCCGGVKMYHWHGSSLSP